MTILDCEGILYWPCGRYLAPDDTWQPVPGGQYRNLPFKCGCLEVELPPGCYWVIAGHITPSQSRIHLNYTTHVGIVQVGCGEAACVKLFNPSLRLCWNWFRIGLRMNAIPRSPAPVDPEKVKQIENLVEELMHELDTPMLPVEKTIDAVFEEIFKSAQEQRK